jgi:hypothetical protein
VSSKFSCFLLSLHLGVIPQIVSSNVDPFTASVSTNRGPHLQTCVAHNAGCNGQVSGFQAFGPPHITHNTLTVRLYTVSKASARFIANHKLHSKYKIYNTTVHQTSLSIYP